MLQKIQAFIFLNKHYATVLRYTYIRGGIDHVMDLICRFEKALEDVWYDDHASDEYLASRLSQFFYEYAEQRGSSNSDWWTAYNCDHNKLMDGVVS